jgi:YidC/Oxa1 family membrane protein insertase
MLRWLIACGALIASSGAALAQDGGVGGNVGQASTGPSTQGPSVPGKVETSDYFGEQSKQQPEREERVIVGFPADKPAVVYTFTNRGGSMSKAVLQDPRFTHAARNLIPSVPPEKLLAGQIDLVSTWGPKWLPFGTTFGKLSYPGQVTLVLRKASDGIIEGGVLKPPADRAKLAVDRPIKADDLLVVTAPADVAGEYKIASVGSGGALTPVKEFAAKAATGVTYEVKRTGSIEALYDDDRTFVRVSATPGLPLVYVWPNPAFDSSPVFIERRFDAGQHPFELKLSVTVHNVGTELLQVQTGIRIGAWQHPETGSPGLFGGPTPVLQASCLAADGLEHAPFASLREAAIEKYEQHQEAVGFKAFPSGTQWVAADTNYFIQAAVPMPINAAGGQCQLGLKDFNPTVPGAWVMWSQFMASNIVEIPKRGQGCVADWLPESAAGVTGLPRCKASLDKLGVTSASSIDEVKQAWEKARAAGGDLAAVDQAYQLLTERRQATWRYNLYNGPKDTAFLPESHPELKRAVQFGWMSFVGAPMHKVLVWFHEGLGSWPLAIILLTLGLKLITWPLSQKSYMSMQKMKNIRPKLDELKRKFGNDRAKFSQEQMALMKREGVNPFAGCLPMLLQFPIWVGLYGAILGSVELYHEPLGLWVPDLSSSDPYFIMPILLGILMFVQTLLTPQTATDETQAKIMKYGMPIMFTVFMLFLPSALVLYILFNTILTIVQNLLIKRRMEARA